MNTPMFTIYAASAGSGKTFTLTKEFLKLALSAHPTGDEPARFSPYYFQHILAVTFTNDAAQEMKKRILETLQALSKFNELPESAQRKVQAIRSILLQEILDTETGLPISEAVLEKRAADTFRVILHQYSRLSVSTIDSFTQRVVSAFTEELNIPYNFEVSLESDVIVAAGVEQLLAKVGQTEFAQTSLVLEELVAEMADKGRSWNSLGDELRTIGRKVLDDKHHDAFAKLEELTTEDFWEIRKQIRAYGSALDTEYLNMARIAVDLIQEKAGISIDDFNYGSTGAAGFLQKVSTGEKRIQDGISSRLQAIVRREEGSKGATWLSKKAPLIVQSNFQTIESELDVLSRELIQLYETQIGKYMLCVELDKHLHKLALLKQLADEVKAIENQSGQIHISRFNQSILKIVLEEPVPFLYERLGEKFHHILIDEFQDTSQLQWLNFMPLIDNSLSSDHYNLVVGDAKQSIYRFRGGEMEQLVHLFQNTDLSPMLPAGNGINWNVGDRLLMIERHLRPEVLAYNRRSCREVVEFNNDFFRYVLDQELKPEWHMTPRIYETYEQKVPENPKSGGHVQMDFLEEDQTTSLILSQIESALALGYSYQDIAILCRWNKDARKLAAELTAHQIPLISADSLLVSASKVVRLIVSFLRVMDTPDQALVKYEAAYLFLKDIKGMVPEEKLNTQIREMVESTDLKAFWHWLALYGTELNPFVLRRVGLYELCEQLIQEFQLFSYTHQAPYLFRFLDYVQDFSTKKSGHLNDFLLDWEQQKNKLCVTTPAGSNAITIQSIHKSKGLEYPVVLLPYANWKVTNRNDDEIWGDLEELELQELQLPASADGKQARQLRTATFSVSKNLAETHLKEAYERETEQAFLDSLNLLYVALTRPVERLYISMELKKNQQGIVTIPKDTVGKLFIGYVGDSEGTHVLKEGNPLSVHSHATDTGDDKLVIPEVVIHDRSGHMRLRRQKDRFTELDSFVSQKDWVNKARAAMREIRTPEDLPLVIDRMQKRGLLDDDQKVKLQGAIIRLLSKPEMKPYFELPGEFLSEQEILMPNGKIIRPDRVVIRPDRTVAILEYKSGSPVSSHVDQMKGYARRYREMGYKHVECWLIYLETGEIQSVGQEPAKGEQLPLFG